MEILSGARDEASSPAELIAYLLSLPGVNARVYWRLLERIDRVESLWQWPAAEILLLFPRNSHPAVAELYRRRELAGGWQQFMRTLSQLPAAVRLLSHRDPAYPDLLAGIHEPPPILYVQGELDCLQHPQIAFVGSRNASHYGLELAYDFSRCLARAGLAITSGLALGIDGQSHRGALAGAGRTVAVLGSGIDRIYPRRHRQLAQQIVTAGGAIVSEFRPGSEPLNRNFPQRNRIISGLSLGVLVVEAAPRSGSLITARHAMEQNRDVFAIPGSINSPLSRGCHQLLREGALLVESAEDIGRELGHWLSGDEKGTGASPETSVADAIESPAERALWSALEHEPSSLEQLLQRCSLPTADTLAKLADWELCGLVLRDGDCYLRSRHS